MKTICAYCKIEIERQKSRIKVRNYCCNSHQMLWEYANGKDKIQTTKRAQETIKKRSLLKFKTNPTKNLSKIGYWMIYIPMRGWMKEHHYIFCQHHNIDKIPEGFVIHHIDFNKLNNSIENLTMMEKKEHNSLHAKISNEQNKEKFREYARSRKRDNSGRFI